MRDLVKGIQIVYKLVIIRKERKSSISKGYFELMIYCCVTHHKVDHNGFFCTSTHHNKHSKVVHCQKIKRGFKPSVDLNLIPPPASRKTRAFTWLGNAAQPAVSEHLLSQPFNRWNGVDHQRQQQFVLTELLLHCHNIAACVLD